MLLRGLALAALVLLAGCSGFGVTGGGGAATRDQARSPTPAKATSERATTAESATPDVLTNTQTPLPTATPATAVENPWGKATVTVGLTFADGVQNESRHWAALAKAVQWHNRQNTSAYPLALAVASGSDMDTDITVSVQPFITECHNETSSYTFLYCGPSVESGDTVSATEWVSHSSITPALISKYPPHADEPFGLPQRVLGPPDVR